MMVIGLHERISGHASRVRVLDRIFTLLRKHQDVWWARARKDQIAQWVLDHPEHLPDQAGGHRRVLHERAGAQYVRCPVCPRPGPVRG
jgi:LSD1 subclass zinc finger protein